MKTYTMYICLVGIFFLLFTNSIYPQNEKPVTNENFYWVNLGLGNGSVTENSGALSANASYQFSKNVLSLRSVWSGELFGKSMSDLGLLYGIALKQKPILASFGVGLAIVEGSISHGLFSNKEPEKIGPVMGFPMEVQLIWRPFRILGIGLYGFANINSEQPFYGVTLSLQFGKLY